MSARRHRIDLKSIVGRALTDGRRLSDALVAVTRARWAREARERLGVSAANRGAYVQGLVTRDMDSTGTAGVDLVGTMPNIFEQGMGPSGVGSEGSYDVRKFVLKPGTSNLKHGKKGMYVNIPFSHTAGAILAAGGKGALKAAKALPAYRPGGGRGQGLGAEHGDRLSGLVRQEDSYSRGAKGPVVQSRYTTWRTMSEGGKPWMSKGIAARRIAQRVLAAMPDLIAMVLGKAAA